MKQESGWFGDAMGHREAQLKANRKRFNHEKIEVSQEDRLNTYSQIKEKLDVASYGTSLEVSEYIKDNYNKLDRKQKLALLQMLHNKAGEYLEMSMKEPDKHRKKELFNIAKEYRLVYNDVDFLELI